MLHKLKEIKEGWKNVLFSDPKIEAIAVQRAELCAECPHSKMMEHSFMKFIETSKTIQMQNVMLYKCDQCGCPLSAKTRSLFSECPIKKWYPAMKANDAELKLEEMRAELCRLNQTLETSTGLEFRKVFREPINAMSALMSTLNNGQKHLTYKKDVTFYHRGVSKKSPAQAFVEAISSINTIEFEFNKIASTPAFTDSKNEFINIPPRCIELIKENLSEVHTLLSEAYQNFTDSSEESLEEPLNEANNLIEEVGPTDPSGHVDSSEQPGLEGLKQEDNEEDSVNEEGSINDEGKSEE